MAPTTCLAAIGTVESALLAKFGYDGSPTSRIDLAAFALVIIGAGVSGLLPRLR